MNVRTSSLTFIALIVWAGPACAQEMPHHSHHCIEWERLNLNQQQNQRIQQLKGDWQGQYSSVMPQIRHQQQHLNELFRNPQSDPLEIVSTQQSVMRMQEQLRNEAMSNYLHKRALLNDMQQRQLEVQMHQMVVERQQQHNIIPVNHQPEENNGIMGIMQKVHWAIEPR